MGTVIKCIFLIILVTGALVLTEKLIITLFRRATNYRVPRSVNILIFIGILFVSLFGFSMAYRLYCDSREWHIVAIKGIAKSAHFALNALTSPVLYDFEGYTIDLLQWVEKEYGFLSFRYFYLGIVLIIAPLSTVACIVSVFERIVKNAYIGLDTVNQNNIIFFHSSDENILLAKSLNKKLVDRNYVFCRANELPNEKKTEKERLISNTFRKWSLVDESELDYPILGKDNMLVLCVNNLDEFKHYINDQYLFPNNIKRLLVISKGMTKQIEEKYHAVYTKKKKNPKLLIYSIYDRLINRFMECNSNGDNGDIVIVSDGQLASYLKENYVPKVNNGTLWFYEITDSISREFVEGDHHFYYVEPDKLNSELVNSIKNMSEGTVFLCSEKNNIQFKSECWNAIKDFDQVKNIRFIVYTTAEQLTNERGRMSLGDNPTYICVEELYDAIVDDLLTSISKD